MENKQNQKLSITKHNALIKSSYRLSLMEIRIVLYGIALINPITKEFPISYEINIKKFALLFEIEEERLYDELKQIVLKKFWRRDFSYIDEEGKTVLFRWLMTIKYHNKKGYLELFYNPLIKPLLQDLQEHFTTYYLEHVKKMRSRYSIRIYEICIMEYNKQKEYINNEANKVVAFKVLVSELKEFLMLENRYARFVNFKTKVLEKARTEINKYSDIKMSYEIEKEGHTPHEIIFILKRKKTKEDQAKIEERALKEEEKRKWKELPLATILQQRVQRIEECSEN